MKCQIFILLYAKVLAFLLVQKWENYLLDVRKLVHFIVYIGNVNELLVKLLLRHWRRQQMTQSSSWSIK